VNRSIKDFAPVEFRRGEWKGFETYATDFLTNTAALAGDVVGAYARVRAACWAYGNGWSLRASRSDWTTHAGVQGDASLEIALRVLEERGVLLVERGESDLAIADPAMHAVMLRKQRARERKGNSRERRGVGQGRTRSETSRGKSRERSREKSRGTSVLPPSSSPLPPSSSESGTDAAPSEPCPARSDSTESSSQATVKDAARDASSATRAKRRPRREWGEAGTVLAHYAAKHPTYRPDEAGRRLVLARIRDGYSVEELVAAIDGAHLSPWHAGTDPKRNGATALSLGVILGTSDQVTKFAELFKAGPRNAPIPGGTSDYLVG